MTALLSVNFNFILNKKKEIYQLPKIIQRM